MVRGWLEYIESGDAVMSDNDNKVAGVNAAENGGAGDESPAMSFEEAIGELELIVSKLERGDMDLEASIVLFQRGIDLTDVCGKILVAAEGKIVKLIKDADGNVAEENFYV